MNRQLLRLVLLPCLVWSSWTTYAQNKTIDSLRTKLLVHRKDTAAISTLITLTTSFFELDDWDSAQYYSNLAVKLAVELKHKRGEAMAKYYHGISLRLKEDYAKSYVFLEEAKKLFIELGDERYTARCIGTIGKLFADQDNATEALENYFSALALSEKIRDSTESMRNLLSITQLFHNNEKYEKALEYARKYEAYAYSQGDLRPRDIITQRLGYIYRDLENDSLSLHYQLESLHLSEIQHDTLGIANSYMDLGRLYSDAQKYPQSIEYLSNAEKMYRVIDDTSGIARSFFTRAQTYEAMNNSELALQEYFQSLHLCELQKDYGRIADSNFSIGIVYLTLKEYRKAEEYFQNYLAVVRKSKQSDKDPEVYKYLSQVSEKLNKPEEALLYLNRFIELEDSTDRNQQQENLIGVEAKRNFERVVQESKMQQAKENFEARIKIYSLLAATVFLILVAILLFRNSNQKQKAKVKIEKAFEELKTTQAQLIQSEKMASLGELTAGIAHEIQNPLNFVNNFSEVNTELIEEANQEIEKGNISDVKVILKDIKDNGKKINEHGKRADAIVKGMLQHSRTSGATKEPTNINALADEFLRLAYHGLRAKDKSFNATMKTDFQQNIGTVNVIPQDIGRVILNLINNAFYAVNEKKKESGAEYEPIVSISTCKYGDKVLISVKDNGNGIPKKVLDKIFQPFFTTKPPGQGTGLGLSLSYDLVKAQGGVLTVETKEGYGSEFVIQVPQS